MNEIGELLKKIRESRKLSYRKAGEISGVSHSYIRYLEIGKRPGSNTPIKPSPETLEALSKAYDYPYEKLMKVADYIKEDEPIYKTEATDSLEELNELVKEYGIEQFGFFDIEKWKHLSPQDLKEIRDHFDWVVQKAKEREKEHNNDN